MDLTIILAGKRHGEHYAPGMPGHGEQDHFNRHPGEPGYGEPLGNPAYYLPGHVGYGQPDEYGRRPGEVGYGQPARPGYYTRGQPGYGRPDEYNRTPDQQGYGQFGPHMEPQAKRKHLSCTTQKQVISFVLV